MRGRHDAVPAVQVIIWVVASELSLNRPLAPMGYMRTLRLVVALWYEGSRMTHTVGSGDMLGDRLRTAREAALLSPDELAAVTGMTEERVHDIEHGGSLGASELERIAAAVGRDVHGLLLNGDVREVLMRAGDAERPAIDDAVGILTRFVRDYEFLLSLDG